MKSWRVALVSVGALVGVVLLVYLAWQNMRGANQFSCVSTAYSFGCLTHAGDFFGLVAAFVVGAVVYLWSKFRGY